jgi:hypothetical protein
MPYLSTVGLAIAIGPEVAESTSAESQRCPRPRVGPPSLVYRGAADEHLRGQGCYPEHDDGGENRTVIFACGCRANVPWWTLEKR